MAARLLLGIDVGTTSVKAVVADTEGNLLAQAGQEYPTLLPHAAWAEQDPELWWRTLGNVLRSMWATSGVAAADVAATSVSSQAPTLVVLDRAGHVRHNALLWLDRRAEAECNWIREVVGDEVVASINGGRVDSYYLAPKLLWMARNQPELLTGDGRILTANGFIAQRLTGVSCMDATHGPLTQLFDSAAGQWSDRLLSAMQVDERWLPPVRLPGEVIGEVSTAASQLTGLPKGVPVLAGMVDGTAAALEAGVLRTGDAVEMTGQSTVLLICSDRPYLGRDLIPLGHAIAGHHIVVGALVATGGSLRWFRDNLADAERAQAVASGEDTFDLMAHEAAQAEAGAGGVLFLPWMAGERSPIWDSRARGVFCGLSLKSTRGELIRAIFEGAAFGLRHNLEIAHSAGFPVQRLSSVGGGARSPLWNQIKADILQRKLHLPKAATGAPMGNAILASVAVGLHPSIEAAVDAMVRPGSVVEPDTARSARYDALYHVYQGLYPALRNSFAELAQAVEVP